MLPKKCPIARPRKRRTPKKDLEGAVVRDCLIFLKDHPKVVYFERRNTGAIKFDDGRFMRFGQKGAADIWCLLNTARHLVTQDQNGTWFRSKQSVGGVVHVEIECKRGDGKGRLSPDQRKFREFCDNRNISYILTTSAEGLAAEIAKILG